MIITAFPGSWQQMIQRNLEMQQSVDVVGIAQGSLSALQLARKHNPDLLLIDSAFPSNDTIALIQSMKQENLETRSIVITNTTQQGRRFIRAGADYTLLTFDFDSQISEILNQMKRTLLNETEDPETSFD